jgi:hypothetical protein
LARLIEGDIDEVLAILNLNTFCTKSSHSAPGDAKPLFVGDTCEQVSRLGLNDGIKPTSLDWHGWVTRDQWNLGEDFRRHNILQAV